MDTPGKRVRPNRPVERAAVRAVAAVFENANFVVQSVDGANDIGKDLYVDVTEGGRATGELIAVQVKGGASYRRSSGYAIPFSVDDLALWADSTVPIFGVVHDPDSSRLHWINLTAWARAQTTPVSPMEAPIASTWTLSERTLPAFVREARSFLAVSGPPALVGLADPDPEVQRAAICDAFALGRRDPRPLLLLRAALRYLSAPGPLRLAVSVLTLCVGHGDIFWTAANWIEPTIAKRVRESFDWSYDELCQLLAAADPEEYSRGGLGQSVHALVTPSRPEIAARLEAVVLRGPIASAWPALMMLADDVDENALELHDRLVPQSVTLRGDPVVAELRAVLVEHGSVSMY